MDIPLQLRANDVQFHIINIDSRFRDTPERSQASNFHFTMPTQIRNILRIRLTSIEFPNNYYMFTEKRHNTTLRIIYKDSGGNVVGEAITIPDGNYTAYEMETQLNMSIQEHPLLITLSVQFVPTTGHFIFKWDRRFAVDPSFESIERISDYGLGFYLGFKRSLHKSIEVVVGTPSVWEVESDMLATFSGDSYFLLRLNDYKCVSHYFEGNTVDAFAKILLRDSKNTLNFDDYAGDHIKEVVMTGPQDLKRFTVQILDPYGQLVDLCHTNFSFSLEILEIKNVNLYSAVRDSLATPYAGVHRQRL
jgi:hypothetical protein